MAGGKVNRTVLQSFYQSPGDIYDDAKTEGAVSTVADQVDANWDDFLIYQLHNHDSRYYTQAQVDTRLNQLQAGQIVDNTIMFNQMDNAGKLAYITGSIYAHINLGGF